MKKILLIDDHKVIRAGTRGLLYELYKQCIVDEADDANSATEKFKINKYDLVMMDIQIPKNDMLGLMEYINIKYPLTKVLMFSMSLESMYAKPFMQAGAKGFLSKDSELSEIKKAITLVMNNRKYISEELTNLLLEATLTDSPLNPFSKLSGREFGVVKLLLSGQTVTTISRSLSLAASTVGTHKSRAFEKLGVNNLIDLKELATNHNM